VSIAFAGDHSDGVTPDPIPNSAVKPVAPMILSLRESRSSPAFFNPRTLKVRGLFFAHIERGVSDVDRVVQAVNHPR
jgi:hypothetical protein